MTWTWRKDEPERLGEDSEPERPTWDEYEAALSDVASEQKERGDLQQQLDAALTKIAVLTFARDAALAEAATYRDAVDEAPL